MNLETGGKSIEDGPGPAGKPRGTGNGRVALTIGTFDGVHIGHQSLLERTRRIAEERGIESAAYTYEVPPRRHLKEEGPPLLMEPAVKKERLLEYVDRVFLGDFPEMRDYTPEEFVERVLVERLDTAAVVVGADWRFGRNRSGSFRDLERLSNGRFSVHPEEQVKKEGRPVSSTWIREAIKDGNMELATELLGRYPAYRGTVVRGYGVGVELGIPTANLNVDDRIVSPKDGSYAALVELEKEVFKGAAHVGNRPTFESEEGSEIEVHLMGFDGDLYGKELKVDLVRYLNQNNKYSELGELKEAIEGYIKRAEKVLNDLEHSFETADS
ncbi:MAG: riboflavin biosynthesis protein RibF [Candidatus Bipolaricaulota bacterium]